MNFGMYNWSNVTIVLCTPYYQMEVDFEMNKMTITLCLIGVSILTLVGCGTQFTNKVNTVPNKLITSNSHTQNNMSSQSSSPLLSSVDMINQTTGWAISNTAVWYTTNGATTWKNVSPKGLNVSTDQNLTMYCLDKQHAWIVTTNSGFSAFTEVYETSNSGVSWTESNIKALP